MPARAPLVGVRRLHPSAVARATSSTATATVATDWRAAVVKVFPYLPPQIGVARNVTTLRTVGWMLARMAAINLSSDPFIVRGHTRFRRWLEEIAVTLLSAPTNLTDDDVLGPAIR